MNRMNALSAAIYSAALSLSTLPAVALAQATRSPAPVDSPAPNGPQGTNWLWILAAILVLAIVWWAVSSRRRGTTSRM